MENKSKKIFIADDDSDILDVVKLMLERKGYEVVISSDGKEIFNYEKADLPDLILLDVWMSGVDGREVCQMLKENDLTKNIPVFFLSANSNIKAIADQYNANGFISKPFDIHSLLTIIHNQLYNA